MGHPGPLSGLAVLGERIAGVVPMGALSVWRRFGKTSCGGSTGFTRRQALAGRAASWLSTGLVPVQHLRPTTATHRRQPAHPTYA